MAEPNPFAQFVEEQAAPDPALAAVEPPADPPADAPNPFAQFEPDEGPGAEDPDEDPALKQVAPGIYIPEDRSIADYITGAAEVAATVASSAVSEPLAGLKGIGAAMVEGGETGAEAVESGRVDMTYQPRGEVGQEMLQGFGTFLAPVGEALSWLEEGIGETVLDVTGSPVAAAAAHTVPTALMEVLGLGLLKKPSQAAIRAAKAQERVALNKNMTPEQRANAVMEAEMRSHEQIATDLRTDQDIAGDVRPDQEILDAAEGLGVELNPSHYSTNEAYRRVEQAVKSQPKSRLLAAREAEAITKLGEKADELIGDFGGSLDKTLLDAKVRGQIDSTIKELKTNAEHIYRQVNDAISGKMSTTGKRGGPKVNARASKAYLDARLEELGGDVSGLSKSERALHGVLSQDRPPTYARLDQLRRDVGAGFKQKGVYADDLTGNLDQVYSALIRDQQGVADAFKVGKEFAAGRKLVQTRKDLEKQAMKLFGKDLNRSILPKLTQASTALTKGDVQQFKTLMSSLPENLRTQAAATMLNDLFTHGARTGGSLGQGFARAYVGLTRNSGAKAELFKYLPKDAQRRFDAIGKVSEGIFRAKALENTSRTARDILEALESGGMVARITDKASDTILGRMTFVPGPTRWIASAAKASKSVAKEAFDRVKAADNLMGSNEFNAAIQKAAEGSVKEADIMLKRSKAWQRWRGHLGEGNRRQLSAMGPIAWLTQKDEEPAAPAAPPAAAPPAAPPGGGQPGG
jgi:hypothetical protein